MALLDFLDKIFKTKDPAEVTQGDIIQTVRKYYPQYDQESDQQIVQRVATKVPGLEFLSNYQPDKPIPPTLVPRGLRSEAFYSQNQDIARADAADTIERFKARYPLYKNVDDQRLADAMEKKWPDQFKGLTSRLKEPIQPPSAADLGTKPEKYTTELTPAEEVKFNEWVKKNNVPFDPSPAADYDMRGFFKAMTSGDPRAKSAINPNDQRLHFPDTWKTPFHKTFSNESIYAGPGAPRWEGSKLVDSKGQVLVDEAAQPQQPGQEPQKTQVPLAQRSAAEAVKIVKQLIPDLDTLAGVTPDGVLLANAPQNHPLVKAVRAQADKVRLAAAEVLGVQQDMERSKNLFEKAQIVAPTEGPKQKGVQDWEDQINTLAENDAEKLRLKEIVKSDPVLAEQMLGKKRLDTAIFLASLLPAESMATAGMKMSAEAVPAIAKAIAQYPKLAGLARSAVTAVPTTVLTTGREKPSDTTADIFKKYPAALAQNVIGFMAFTTAAQLGGMVFNKAAYQTIAEGLPGRTITVTKEGVQKIYNTVEGGDKAMTELAKSMPGWNELVRHVIKTGEDAQVFIPGNITEKLVERPWFTKLMKTLVSDWKPFEKVLKVGGGAPEVRGFQPKAATPEPETPVAPRLLEEKPANAPVSAPAEPPPAAKPPTPPLRPEPIETVSPSPARPPKEGWTTDAGAMPGEPMQTYKDRYAIVEQADDQGNVLYEVTRNDGQPAGTFSTLEEAQDAAEKNYAVDEQLAADSKKAEAESGEKIKADLRARFDKALQEGKITPERHAELMKQYAAAEPTIDKPAESGIIPKEDQPNEPTDKRPGSGAKPPTVPEPVQVGPEGQGGTGIVPAGDAGQRPPEQPTDAGTGRNGAPGNRPGPRLTNQEIEALVASKPVDQFTPEEKAQIAQYSGAGGQAKKGQAGRGLLDEYYTPKVIADRVWSVVKKLIPDQPKILEPSVGTGRFLEGAPSNAKLIAGYEINPTAAKIAQILHPGIDPKHPNVVILNKPFESIFVGDRGEPKKFEGGYDLVIGNPPYGEHRGRFLGLGEEPQIAKYEDYFIKRGLDLTKEGGYVAMVVPSGFLRSTLTEAKKKIIGLGELVDAVRLPEKTFENTSIGTDIIIIKRQSSIKGGQEGLAARTSALINDNFFKEHPEKILGVVKTRKGRFGKEETYVEGELTPVEEETTAPANTEDRAGNKPPAEVTPRPEENQPAVDAEADMEEIDPETAAEINKDVVIEATKKDKTIAIRDVDPGPGGIEAWDLTLPTGELSKPIPGANYMSGKYYNDFMYYQGDIYEKLDRLERDAEKLTPAQYEKQKAGLMKVLPEPAKVENVKLSPIDPMVSGLEMKENKTLADQFLDFLERLPREAFKSSSEWEVTGYVRGDRVTGRDKNENRLIRRRRREVGNELFLKFLREDLAPAEQTKVMNLYNRFRNAVAVPDYSKVPMLSKVNATFKGRQLVLRDIQQTGAGFLVTKGVGGLAWEVGGGKTLGAILALNELLFRGWIKRPLIVVPRGRLYNKWIEELKEVMPGIKINSLENLGGKFKGDLKTLTIPEGSVSIISYEGANRLSFKDETYQELTADLQDTMKEPVEKTDRGREKEKTKIEQTVGKGMKGTTTERFFEDLGFDHVVFDEAHRLKNIFEQAKINKAGGARSGRMGNKANEFANVRASSSARGVKGYLITQYLMNKHNGRGVFLLSATPFTNNPIEYYSMMSLLARRRLQSMGLKNVNDFMTAFMEMKTSLIVKADRTVTDSEVIEKFKNANELRKLLAEYWDFKDGEDLGVHRPNKARKKVYLNPNQQQVDYMELANQLFQDKENGGPMVAAGELQNITISPYMSRYYQGPLPTAQDFVENSPKIKATMEMIAQNKKDHPGAGMIVYMPRGVHFHPLLKEYLIKNLKYKPAEIGIINGETTGTASGLEAAETVMEEFNQGKVKIIIGSDTIKEGIDLQKNTTDMYVLHLPYNPTDLQQVEGRGWRHGNIWKNIRVNYPMIRDSVDPFIFQKLETKEKRIKDAREKTANEIDVSDINFEELKLELITNPVVKMTAERDMVLAKMTNELQELKSEKALNERRVIAVEDAEQGLADMKHALEDSIRHVNESGGGKDRLEATQKYYGERIKKYETQLAKAKEKLVGVDTKAMAARNLELETKIGKLENDLANKQAEYDQKIREEKGKRPPKREAEPNDYEQLRGDLAKENQGFFVKNLPETRTVKTKKPAKPAGAKFSVWSQTIDTFERLPDGQAAEPAQRAPSVKLYDDMRKFMQKWTQRFGERYHSKKALGETWATGTVRTNSVNDVSTNIHEVAHAIDLAHKILDKVKEVVGHSSNGNPIYNKEFKKVRKALTDIYVESYPGAGRDDKLTERVDEGFATFVQKFAEQPTAIAKKYPLLVREFLTKEGRLYHPDIVEAIKDIHEIVKRYQAQDALQKIGSTVTDTRAQDTIRDSYLNFWDKFVTQVVDEIHPIEKLAVENGTVRTASDPSLWIRQYQNVNQLITNNILGKHGYWIYNGREFIKYSSQNIGDLVQMLRKKGNTQEFGWFLAARDYHFDFERLDVLQEKWFEAQSLLAKLNQKKAEGGLLTGEDRILARQAAADIKAYQDLKNVLEREGVDRNIAKEAYMQHRERFSEEAALFDSLTRGNLLMLRAGHLITPKTFQELSSREGYASRKRDVFDEILGSGAGPLPAMRVGNTRISSLIKRKGSKLTRLNPLYSLIKDHREIYRKVMKQVVYNSMAVTGKSFPDLFHKLELVRAFDKNTGKITYPQEKDPNIIMARGPSSERIPFLVSREIKNVLDDVLDWKSVHILEQWARRANRIFTKGTTGAYPLFAFTNFVMDQVSSAANTRNNFIPIFTPLNILMKRLMESNSPEARFYEEYLVLAGERQTFAHWQDLPPDELFQKIDGEKGHIQRFVDLIDAGMDILSIPSAQSEILTRAAEYVKSRKAGNPQIVALEDAGRVSAPFHHMGEWGGSSIGKTWVRAVPFMNPGIQASAQYLRSVLGNQGQTRERAAFVTAVLAAVTVGSMVYIMKKATDTQKKLIAELEPDELASYLWFPYPDGKRLWKIRIPENMNLVGTLTNMILNDMMNSAKYDGGDYLNGATALLPDQMNFTQPTRQFLSIMPQIIKPAINVLYGKKDWPNLRPLESMSMEKKEPRFRFNDNTSEFAKYLGDKFNKSPVKIDYLIEEYMGRVSRFFTGKTIPNPFVRDWYFTSGRTLEEYYDDREKTLQAIQAYKGLSRGFTPQEERIITERQAQIRMVDKMLKAYDVYVDYLKEGKIEEKELVQLRNRILNEIDTFRAIK